MEKVKQEIIMSPHIIGPFTKKKLAPSEKVTPNEEVEKVTNLLDDMDNTKFTEKLNLQVSNDSMSPNNSKNKRGMI